MQLSRSWLLHADRRQELSIRHTLLALRIDESQYADRQVDEREIKRQTNSEPCGFGMFCVKRKGFSSTAARDPVAAHAPCEKKQTFSRRKPVRDAAARWPALSTQRANQAHGHWQKA